MTLTRSFKETVQARAKKDRAFRAALLSEGVEALLQGDVETGKSVLRDYINATIGFESLAAEVGAPSKSLHRMLGPAGNPSTTNFFGIVSALQKKTGVQLRVTAE